jgi:hypothetical protein
LETKLSLTTSFDCLKSIIEVTTIVVVVATGWVSCSWVDMALKIYFITIIIIIIVAVGFIEDF